MGNLDKLQALTLSRAWWEVEWGPCPPAGGGGIGAVVLLYMTPLTLRLQTKARFSASNKERAFFVRHSPGNFSGPCHNPC